MDNASESFAESVVAYRYFPENLKRVNPEAYEYMKYYIFSGREYGSFEQCSPQTELYQQIMDKAQQLMQKEQNGENGASEKHRRYRESCLKDLYLTPEGATAKSFDRCMNSTYIREVLRSSDYPWAHGSGVPLYLQTLYEKQSSDLSSNKEVLSFYHNSKNLFAKDLEFLNERKTCNLKDIEEDLPSTSQESPIRLTKEHIQSSYGRNLKAMCKRGITVHAAVEQYLMEKSKD